jgi:Fe-Mn family superoxide dismutase
MDIRKTLDLLEDKSQQDLIQLPLDYSNSALAPVMSKKTIEYHYDKLYKGYVDRFNTGEGDPEFNRAGAILHLFFFAQFGKPGTPSVPEKNNKPVGDVKEFINKHFKSFADFKKQFKEAALALQGSGWVYLAKSGKIKTIKNHEVCNDVVVILDMWEHAYNLDYAENKSEYIDNFWKIIDWYKAQSNVL